MMDDTDVDELSDVDASEGFCQHPEGAREYYTAVDDGCDHVLWKVFCTECGEALAQGADRV